LQPLGMMLFFQIMCIFIHAHGNDIPRSGSLSFQHIGRVAIIA